MNYLKEGIEILKEYNKLNLDLEINFSSFRGLMNITYPNNLDDKYFEIEEKIIKKEYENKKIINVEDLDYFNNIAIYKGDITLIKADAIANAGNEMLLGCFVPNHFCIDNAIHSFAGLKVRKDLMSILKGNEVDVGEVVVTKGYNLPSKFIFHTVGPKAFNGINKKEEDELKLTYLNLLNKAIEMNINYLVIPSISTGIYGFPIKKASKIVFELVSSFLKDKNLKVVFNLFSNEDYLVYERLFSDFKKRN